MVCIFCGYDVMVDEYFFLRDEAWPLDSDGGLLCVACVERRIGRRLVPEDFRGSALPRSERLRARMEPGDDKGAPENGR